ncbi:oligosaccharide flippase family protein [Inhella sp.]|uniref:oligosaccharide flippase family protein n=1 Tax=Inhella sp. TaxID=1921806 RepID=UPI001AC67886|nr:oligosaccharide flippase family protein [Burkholderiales bacterium]
MSVHRALRVTTLASAVNLLLALVSAVLLARWLTPAEIGVFSVAVSLTAFTHILREFGVGQYFLQLKELTREHLRAGFTAMLLVSWSLAALLALVAAPVGAFYREPSIAEVFYVLALSFVVLPFGSHVLSQLKRDLAFDKIAWLGIVNTVVQTVVTLVLAWFGHSSLSMAWGTLAGNVANVLLLWAFRPDVAWLRPTAKHLRALFGFGGTVSSASLLAQAGAAAPDLVLGRTQSVVEVAQYSRAGGLLNMLVARIDTILLQVFTPVFAQRLRDGQAAAPLLAHTIRLHTGLVMPLTCGLAVIAGPLTLLMFGSQWQVAAELAPLLLLYAALVAPMTFASSALVAGGHVGSMLRANLWSNGALLLVLLSSIWLNLAQMVMLLLLARLAHAAAWQFELHHRYGFGPRAALQACAPSLLLSLGVSLPMLLAVPLANRLPTAGYIALQCALGTLSFVLVLRHSHHPLRTELPRLAPPLKKLFPAP